MEVTHTNLAVTGRDIDSLFLKLIKKVAPRLNIANGFWKNEYDRFDLWANSLGLHHTGHSSLDYRLRDAESLRDYVEGLLDELKETLDESMLRRGRLPSNVLADESAAIESLFEDDSCGNEQSISAALDEKLESALSEYADESESETLQAAITDILDRLYRFAIRLRNPATRLATAKANHFAQVDKETGVDPIKEFKKCDLNHILELFLSYRSVGDDRPEDQGKRLSEEDNVLLSRLAAANTYRRQQFGRWARHKIKALKETAKALEEPRSRGDYHLTQAKDQIGWRDESARTPISKAFSKPTTASHLPSPTIVRLDDAASTLSGRTVSPNAQGTHDEQVEVPDPPPNLQRQKHFQCPYCFMLCSRAHLEKEAWREHVLRDLRPYVCTYADCKTGDRLYNSWKDWATHEQWTYNKVWRCEVHADVLFYTAVEFREHLLQEHSPASVALEDMLSTGAGVSEVPERPCPFCLHTAGTLTALQNHIATHLQRVALFALPRSTGSEDESVNDENRPNGENASDDAIAANADSRDGDFEEDHFSYGSFATPPPDSQPSSSSALSATPQKPTSSPSLRLEPEQMSILEELFSRNPRPTTAQKKVHAQDLGLTILKVNNWFQNRRAYVKLQNRMRGKHEVSPKQDHGPNLQATGSPSLLEFDDQLPSGSSVEGPLLHESGPGNNASEPEDWQSTMADISDAVSSSSKESSAVSQIAALDGAVLEFKHWLPGVFAQDRPTTPLNTSSTKSTCYGKHQDGVKERIEASYWRLQSFHLDDSGLAVHIYLRATDRRARLLCVVARDGRQVMSSVPCTMLRITRRDRGLQLCTVNDQRRWFLWLHLVFPTFERLALFHCAFLALKAQDEAHPVKELQDTILEGEALLFSAIIIDDNYEHTLKILQDEETQLVRLQASAARGPLRRCPIWTAFITFLLKSNSSSLTKRSGPTTVCLRRLNTFILTLDYKPQMDAEGVRELQFVHESDTRDFLDTIEYLVRMSGEHRPSLTDKRNQREEDLDPTMPDPSAYNTTLTPPDSHPPE